jgi:hypothetical protein
LEASPRKARHEARREPKHETQNDGKQENPEAPSDEKKEALAEIERLNIELQVYADLVTKLGLDFGDIVLPAEDAADTAVVLEAVSVCVVPALVLWRLMCIIACRSSQWRRSYWIISALSIVPAARTALQNFLTK